MNTRKQVLVMSALLMVALVLIGIYAAWYPSRASNAEEHFKELTAERGAILFARNCRLCHGDVGEGGAAGARLPAAPALDRPDLQGFSADANITLTSSVNASATTIQVSNGNALATVETILVDSERMRVKGVSGNTVTVQRGVDHTEAAPHASGAAVLPRVKATLDRQIDLITDTITCGRVGTAMPFWAQSQGGPLSNEQIRQLMVLITEARWDLVKEEVDKEDRVASRLTQPVDAETVNLRVSDVSVFTEGEVIRIGDERMRVTGVPRLPRDARGNLPSDRSGIIEVQRGVLGTTPFDHSPDEPIYRFPEAPQDPTINQSSCGQTARPTAPPEPPGTIEPFEGQTVNVVAVGIAFDVREIRVNRGGQVRVRLDNRDIGVQHNIAFYQSSTNLTPVAPGAIGTTFAGPGIDDTVFNVPPPGTYFFRCDVHPTTMTGTFIVQ